MKKYLKFAAAALVTVIVVIIGVASYFVFIKKPELVAQLKLYKNEIQGYELWYPETLVLNKQGNQIRLSHLVQIPFSYADPCDTKGDGSPKTNTTATDFDVTFQLINRSQADIYNEHFGDNIVKELFNNNLKLNTPKGGSGGGYQGLANIGSLSGHHFWRGLDGCGTDIYFFSIDQNNILVIRRILLYVASNDFFKKIDSVITTEDEEKIFNEIISTFKLVESAHPVSMKVISPNGGEKWKTGETHTIKWETTNYPFQSEVEIFLLNNLSSRSPTRMIVTTNNAGTYGWIIPPTLENRNERLRGDSFKIQVLLTEALVDDKSDNVFSIGEGLKPPLALISPSGGKLIKGNIYPIKWTSTLPEDTIIDISFRKKEIKSGRDYGRLFRTQNNGFKEWLVSKDINTGDDYILEIIAYSKNFNTLASDVSEIPFSIKE